jgi:hypothetical protein
MFMIDLIKMLKCAAEGGTADQAVGGCAGRLTLHGIYFASKCSILKLTLGQPLTVAFAQDFRVIRSHFLTITRISKVAAVSGCPALDNGPRLTGQPAIFWRVVLRLGDP